MAGKRGPDGQRPLVRVMNGGADAACAPAENAWGRVMEGFVAALKVEDLPPSDRAYLLQCHRLVGEISGRPHLASVQGHPADRARSAS
jgi:hypothetical protein